VELMLSRPWTVTLRKFGVNRKWLEPGLG
jgi:hypothetical protein